MLQSAITSAVETAMKMTISELATTLDTRISQRLWEHDQLSSTTSVAPHIVTSGVPKGSNNSTTSSTLHTNNRLPVGEVSA